MCLLSLHQELPTGNSGSHSLLLLLLAPCSFLVPALGMCCWRAAEGFPPGLAVGTSCLRQGCKPETRSSGGPDLERTVELKAPVPSNRFSSHLHRLCGVPCAVVDMFPQFLISRSVLKLLYVSFSVLHTWPQSVEVLPVCTVTRTALSQTPATLHCPSQFPPACGPFLSWFPSHCLHFCDPSTLSMLSPRACHRGSHDFRAICM